MFTRITLLACPILFLMACQSRGYNASVPEATKAIKSVDSALEEQLALAFSDRNPASAQARMEAMLDKSTPAEFKIPRSPTPDRDCTLPSGMILRNNIAEIIANEVLYCKNSHLKQAKENRFLRELLLEAGVFPEELKDVKVYLIPTDETNAWAYSPKNGTGYIILYQGLMKDISGNIPITDDGDLAGTMVHELGHILDMRKVDSSLEDRAEAISKFCKTYTKSAQNREEFAARRQTCFDRIAAISRTHEHSADQNVAKTFQRKLPSVPVNPYKFADWLEAHGGKYNPSSSHPYGTERAFYIRKSLREAGIPDTIPARDSTVKALVNSRAD